MSDASSTLSECAARRNADVAPRDRSNRAHGRRKPHARVRVVASVMAPPVRVRDDAEDETIDPGDAEGNAKPPRGSTTPVKAPRLEKSGRERRARTPPDGEIEKTRGRTCTSSLRIARNICLWPPQRRKIDKS